MDSNSFVYSATQIVVGLSVLTQVTQPEFGVGGYIKFFSGTGASLEIVSGVSAGSDPGPKRGTGYMLGATEILPINGPAQFWLCATAATAIAHMIIAKSEGATLI